MIRRTLPFLLLALFVGNASGQTARQEGEGPPRKRVVLALSGGGAYGLLYLGALEWLERHRIPVDAIAGTSGGALVGGWYATGLELVSDEEIRFPRDPQGAEELRLKDVRPVLAKVDFTHLFDSQPAYGNLGVPAKRERRLYPNDLFGGFSQSRTLRRDGLVPGQSVGFFLDWIGRDYPDGFEGLPIPFRAVAVDAADPSPARWRTVVLGGPRPEVPLGLSRAIRASIAVPVLLAPVEQGRYRLIDGAVRDNLPTDVAIDAFDPDALIAMRFDSGYGPDAYRAGRGGREAREKTILTFDPGPYGVDQFDRWQELAWRGYSQLEALRGPDRERLEALALSSDEYLAYRRSRRARAKDRTVRGVEGDSRTRGALDGVRAAIVGKSLDDLDPVAELGRALDRLVADEALATAGFDLHDGTLRIRTVVPKGGPSILRGGLEIEADGGDRLWYGVRTRVSDQRRGRQGYFLDALAGNEPALKGGASMPVGRDLALEPGFRLDRDIQFEFGDGGRDLGRRIATAEATLALAYRPTRATEYAVGVLAGDRTTVGHYDGMFARATWDTTDDAVVPHTGIRTRLETRSYDGLVQASGSLEAYRGTARDATGLRAGFGTSFGDDAPFALRFRLGGLGSLAGYRRDEVSDDGYLLVGASQRRELRPLPFAFGRVYAEARLESAWARGRAYPGASLGLIADTRLGVGTLALGLAERGAVRLFLGLGRRF